MNKPNKIITHHTGGSDTAPLADTSWATAEDIDSWHKARWPGFTSKQFNNKAGKPYHVGYHFVIHSDGTVVQTRGYDEEGAHCIGQNTSSIGVCFSGNFDVTMPTRAQEKAWKTLYKRLHKDLGILPTRIYPHRRFATKTCHGKLLSDDHFSHLVNTDDQVDVPVKVILDEMLATLIRLKSYLTNNRFGKSK